MKLSPARTAVSVIVLILLLGYLCCMGTALYGDYIRRFMGIFIDKPHAAQSR